MSLLRKVIAKKFDNKFIPKYVPNDLLWYESDGLDTWYQQNKCNDFLNDTDEYFKTMKIVNFDMIKNEVSEETTRQYQQIDHHEIMCYPPRLREEICSPIFRNMERDGMCVKKETVDEHFKIKSLLLVVDDLLKKLGTVCMLRLGILLRKKN